MKYKPLTKQFFNRDAQQVAKALLGKILCVKYRNHWLRAVIIETEAYYLNDKASHASLGYTEKRKGLFMPPGTIYMYYARGGDSLNISCGEKGDAVLIKSAYPFHEGDDQMIKIMQKLNPQKNRKEPRMQHRLCAGQTLLCKALGLTVKKWDQQQFDKEKFYIADVRQKPKAIIQAKRLGIPTGRDEHLFYRFIDMDYANHCTDNPLRKRAWKKGRDYFIKS